MTQVKFEIKSSMRLNFFKILKCHRDLKSSRETINALYKKQSIWFE